MRILTSLLAALATFSALPALAQDAVERVGKPVDGLMGFQPAATDLARDIHFLDNMINWIIAAICLLVIGLVAVIILRYNRRANPTPGTFTHHSTIEVLWTLGPVLVLVFIGAFSLPILFKQQIIPEGDVHIKVTGNQWYWGYEYTDEEFGFDSFLVAREELADYGYSDDEYLLATDTRIIVPVNKVVVMTVTASDVIHSWTIPAFGVKQDAVPGRLAQLWFQADKEGLYFGQCSELCGKDHAYMPITVQVVSDAEYAAWLETAKAEYAGTPTNVTVASAD
ncbi:cytochrome c oxidase subunit II [Lentibacter algarum]|uniref:cytochrome c oxidase subunit II n=1 Tax=Lentibacter algarum TaxID=576131 RepID=UPI001C08E974|nr:cytochrome c oxidase subunit II [Lentibacter algarum]MBU2982952.1 cytochrome c oxidase subunit II [Lentibacter algarum]